VPYQTRESVVDRHRSDADPIRIRISLLMPIQIRNPHPDWNQNDADPHADPTPSFTSLRKSEYFFYTAMPFCNYFIFLISVKCAIIFSIFDPILKFSVAWT
jgi:hypothetical protein